MKVLKLIRIKTFRVVLQNPVNIRQFVDSVNNTVKIVELPRSLQPPQSEMVRVRLFIRPMTYPNPDGNQTAINRLGLAIDGETQDKVSQQTQQPQQQQQQLRAQSQSLDPSNPQTDKFDVLGFTINIEHKPTPYEIPPEQRDTVLGLLPQKLQAQIKEKSPIELLSGNTKARITFKQRLLVKETLKQVNKFDSSNKVNFTTASSTPLNVYLFMVPMTHRIDETTGKSILPTIKAINELEEQEMIKIMVAMKAEAEKRKVVQKATAPAQASQAPESASPAQAPSQAPSKSVQQPRGRGGKVRGSVGGSLSSRGQYRHPNEEYNL